MRETTSNAAPKIVPEGASKLRFPKLLALCVLLFVVDLIVPDFIPMADEIILGLLSLVLAMLRDRPRA